MDNLSPRQTLGLGFIIFVVFYTVFQARFLIIGPVISITSPLDGSTTTVSLISVTGTAKNVTFISINDRPIFLDEKGKFEEKILTHPGLSTIIIKARDRFGRETEKTTRVILKE